MSTMTISQALRRIAKLKGSFKELQARASGSVLYSAENPPAFTFEETVSQLDKVREELTLLETALRVTNAQTSFDFRGKSMTLAEATCRLQEMRGKIAWLKSLSTQAKATRTEVSYDENYHTGQKTEIKKVTVCALPEAQKVLLVTEEQEAFDTLNDVVEAVNHRTTLLQR